jgi:hypothetical protein
MEFVFVFVSKNSKTCLGGFIVRYIELYFASSTGIMNVQVPRNRGFS